MCLFDSVSLQHAFNGAYRSSGRDDFSAKSNLLEFDSCQETHNFKLL